MGTFVYIGLFRGEAAQTNFNFLMNYSSILLDEDSSYVWKGITTLTSAQWDDIKALCIENVATPARGVHAFAEYAKRMPDAEDEIKQKESIDLTQQRNLFFPPGEESAVSQSATLAISSLQ